MAEGPSDDGPVVFGTEDRPFQIGIPGWDDIVHARPPPEVRAEHVRLFNDPSFSNADFVDTFGDRVLSEIIDRRRMIERIQASPLPAPKQVARKWLIALDEAQDWLFTAQLGAAGLSLAAPQVGLPVLGLLSRADAFLQMAMAAINLTNATRRKRAYINKTGSRSSRRNRLKAEGKLALRRLRSPASLLRTSQAAYTATGVGTTIGSVFIFAQDVYWGTVQAAGGDQVEVQHDPDAGTVRRAAETALNTWFSWLGGQFLSIDQHLLLATANTLAMQRALEGVDPGTFQARAEEGATFALPHKRIWRSGTRALLESFDIDPDGPQAWPVEGAPERLSISEALEHGALEHPKWRAELHGRMGVQRGADWLAELGDASAQQGWSAMGAGPEPWTPEWTEDDHFVMGFLEKAPVNERIHPAAGLAGLDSALAWWHANRGSYTNIPGAPEHPERWSEVALRAYRDAYLPEVRRAGGAPRAWLTAGHAGAQLQPQGALRAWRDASSEHGPRTLHLRDAANAANQDAVGRGDEWPLDQLTPTEILDALRSNTLDDEIRRVELLAQLRVPYGLGAYEPFKPPELEGMKPIDQPTRDWEPEAAETRLLWYLDAENFGAYGGTHPNDWTDGGPSNNPFTNVPWGDRWTAYRNVIATIDRAFREGVTRTVDQADPERHLPPYTDPDDWAGRLLRRPLPNGPWMVTWHSSAEWNPHELLVAGWDLVNGRWLGADFSTTPWTPFVWNSAYRATPAVLFTRWDPLLEERIDVDTQIPFRLDLEATLRNWALDRVGNAAPAETFQAVEARERLWLAVHARVDAYLEAWRVAIANFGFPVQEAFRRF